MDDQALDSQLQNALKPLSRFPFSLIILLLDCRWGTINRFNQLRGGNSLQFRDNDLGHSLACAESGSAERIQTSQVSFFIPTTAA